MAAAVIVRDITGGAPMAEQPQRRCRPVAQRRRVEIVSKEDCCRIKVAIAATYRSGTRGVAGHNVCRTDQPAWSKDSDLASIRQRCDYRSVASTYRHCRVTGKVVADQVYAGATIGRARTRAD